MLIKFPNAIVQMASYLFIYFGLVFSCFQLLDGVIKRLLFWAFMSKRHECVEWSIIQIRRKY